LIEPTTDASLNAEYSRDSLFRILTLDGGGAKGFYTLGVLKELEAMLKCPLHKRFDLIFGTSTGAIIASLLALGFPVDQVHELYKQYVPTIMKPRTKVNKSAALARLTSEVLGERKFEDTKTALGVVATRWMTERPMIFKSSVSQAHGRRETFVPGFGVSIADAVEASCSAYPFFERKFVTTSSGDRVELIDGGYCANNPTLYALADATVTLERDWRSLRVVNVGVGVYPEPKSLKNWFFKKWISIQLLQKTLEINTQSMDQLRTVLFKDIRTVRISETFSTPEMATDLLEHDLNKLNVLRQRGRESFASRESDLKALLASPSGG